MMFDRSLYAGDPSDIQKGDECGKLAAIRLPHGELSITGTTKSGKIVFRGPETFANAPTTSNATSLRWVAKFNSILKTAPIVKPDYTKPTAATALFFALPDGTLTSHGVDACVWRMKKRSEKWARSKHALAQEVVLRTEKLPAMDSLEVTIGGKTYKFNVRGLSEARILFGNTPADQMCPQNNPLEKVDAHFDLYYTMLDNAQFAKPEDHRLPHRSDTVECQTDYGTEALRKVRAVTPEPDIPVWMFRIGGANCPPAFMYEPTLTP
jgi:hypothetical protein